VSGDSSLRPADGATIEAQIVVIGAGPIGIVLALELANSHDVLLVDSGGWQADRGVQELGEALVEDQFHSAMGLATQRRIGGATNLWGGRCVPYDPIDFERREVIPDAEWPIGYGEVARYYERACDWCRCGRAIFNATQLPELAGRTLVPGFGDGEIRATDLERWSLPTNFRKVYGRRLTQHPNIRVLTGFTCVELEMDRGGDSVASARVRSLDGRSLRLTAGQFVVAAGGIESARLLLASNARHPGGIGNATGHLGRWYMSHVWARVAKVTFDTDPSETIYGYERDRDGVFVRRRMTFSPDLQKRTRMPNASVWLVNPDVGDPAHGSGVLSFAYLMLASPIGGRFASEAIRAKHLKADGGSTLRAHLRNVLRDLPAAARFAADFGWGRFVKPGRRYPGFFVPSADNSYQLDYHGEHVPRWDSHISLSEARDALGMRRLRTHLDYGEGDVRSVRRGLELLDEDLRARGIGKLAWLYGDVDAATRAQLYGGFHQSGVTRMSREPADGVVDENLAVHGVDNLYVASTGVLPTSSQANTTLTGIALGVRLAERLRSPTE
jgi:choline dehydrogenase-like flavoprotein